MLFRLRDGATWSPVRSGQGEGPLSAWGLSLGLLQDGEYDPIPGWRRNP